MQVHRDPLLQMYGNPGGHCYWEEHSKLHSSTKTEAFFSLNLGVQIPSLDIDMSI